ncbi:hypothetical protein P7C70_g8672, partial [Phenoliferia sp. Uapishka_3]
MRFHISALAALSTCSLFVSALPKAEPGSEHMKDNEKRSARPKVIIDNDFSGSTSWPPTMLLLYAGYEVLGFTVALGNSWVDAESTRILRFLEVSSVLQLSQMRVPEAFTNRLPSNQNQIVNLTQIPVFKGVTFPLINTAARSNAWQAAFGSLGWNGMFNPENATADALGGDPQSGDPYRITPIPEGLPTIKAQNQSAVTFMIEQVHKYPGEVELYVAGGCTNVSVPFELP